jgi:nicotinic acid phosphoribosyltransferase
VTYEDPVSCLFRTDAYKLDHRRQYPPGTVRVYSNYTNRKSRMPGVNKIVHFGLQAYLQRYLMEDWTRFFVGNRSHIAATYKARVARVLGEAAAEAIGTAHIEDLHQLGYLPLRFCALPEGTLVPIRVPAFTVENTHDDFAWLTNFVETGLSAGYWQASTSATIAHEYRKVLEDAARRTGASLADVDYQLHDFSYRGMSSHETAAVSGAAHLLSFRGTDSLVAIDWIDRYYGPAGDGQAAPDTHTTYALPGPLSIPATEHSVMSAGTAVSSEFETFERLLDLYPSGNVAIVSDTYDLWRVLTEYLPKLKNKILARDGKVVVRPDSGDPEKILCGNSDITVWSDGTGRAARCGVVNLLWEVFGGSVNEAGYKELDPHIGVIYGDSITLDRARSITANLERQGFASTTVILGVGSFTYQMNTRDTFGSAMKATWCEIESSTEDCEEVRTGIDLFKDPVTDDGTKKSATGRLAVYRCTEESGGIVFGRGDLTLYEKADPELEAASLLHPVWEDGKFVRRHTFAEVREVLNGH